MSEGGRRFFVRAAVRRSLVLAVMLSSVAWLGAAESASASTWSGTIQGKMMRSTRFGSAGATMRGSFSITVGRRGKVSGSGVVTYDPFFNTDGLNALLGYARGLTQVALGGFPVFGSFAAAQLDAFIGVRVTLQTLPVAQGPIVGTLSGGRLTLNWGGKLPSLPYSAFINIAGGRGDVKLTAGSIKTPQPFGAGAANVSHGWAVSRQQSTVTKNGGTELLSTYWTAQRVG